jgi:ABC-type sugar transport system substrate-binding protein
VSRELNRRELLAAGAAAGVGATLLAPLAAGAATKARPPKSPGGLVIWVPASINDYNLPIDVGFHEAVTLVGWTYQKIGTPEAQASPEASVNNINKALQRRPTVLAVTMLGSPTTAAIKKVLDAKIPVIVVNSQVEPDRENLGVGFVGPSFFEAGEICANRIAAEAMKRGKKSGVIVCGNLFPGGAAIEGRYKGIAAGIQAWNKAKGTSFTTENFPDNALDSVKGLTTYKAKYTQLGSKLAGFAPLGLPSTELMPKFMKDAGLKAGSIAIGGFDTAPDVEQSIKDGYVQFAIDQQFYSQGFVSGMLAWQLVARAQSPAPNYDTGQAVVDSSNVNRAVNRDNLVLGLAKKYGIRI